ncbi:MAG: tRNA lysidine(34) synthetase TilS [Microcoleaceae cyanobacterium]
MPANLNWTPLHDQLHRTLRSRHLIPASERVLMAVSGGQDSLCLAKLLLDLQSKWGWELAIAHCDHGWRSDSAANADYIETLAHSWQLPCYRQVAQEISTTEAAARQWRYQVLAEIAKTNNYTYVVTGHTATDRAETLLYNLVRGSGADGLQALTWQRPLKSSEPSPLLVRPMLDITRHQTGEFCQTQGLRIWLDSTNQDLHYARNRIRLELLPYLETHFNPQTELALAQTAELLQAEVECLEYLTDELYQQAVESADTPGGTIQQLTMKINRQVLRQSFLALQRRVMRRVLHHTLPQAPNFDQIEKLTVLITAPNRSQTDPFPGGTIARVEHPWIIFTSS